MSLGIYIYIYIYIYKMPRGRGNEERLYISFCSTSTCVWEGSSDVSAAAKVQNTICLSSKTLQLVFQVFEIIKAGLTDILSGN